MSHLIWDSVNNFGTGGIATATMRTCLQAFHDRLMDAGFVWSTKARPAQADFAWANNPAKAIYTATLSGCHSYYGPVWNMNGDIDEFRVTNNVARYVANFTPPTDRFPAA